MDKNVRARPADVALGKRRDRLNTKRRFLGRGRFFWLALAIVALVPVLWFAWLMASISTCASVQSTASADAGDSASGRTRTGGPYLPHPIKIAASSTRFAP